MVVFRQAADFFGLSASPMAMAAMMERNSEANKLIDIVLTIRNVKAKEFLLLSCYDLIRNIDNEEAKEVLYNIANDMGYDYVKLNNLFAVYQ